ncbi:RagB/SusD family nutrient uptake outer membrane protein [Adhaeribacter aerolatus]|nr:RagB/SusD family nutrient uptake outer membrane protein [Adhaeribacter aerolatus]
MKCIKFIAVVMLAGLVGCSDLDLNPLSESSTSTFYSNQKELELAVNDLYRTGFFGNDDELYTDNYWHRAQGGNAVTYGTLNADDGAVLNFWNNAYKQIARVNSFLANKDRAKNNTPANIMTRLEAEARFVRAYQYSRLITHFGDVPFLKDQVSLEESYKLNRASKDEILQFIFSELDWAAENLPATYGSGELRRFSKGAALAIKARTALYMDKWAEARDAAKAVMDLAGTGVYALHPSYRDLFLTAAETSKEIIISVPRSQAQGVFTETAAVKDQISRNATGFGAQIPTWELMDSYEATDGLPIDESPLYNPRRPFANRDPRLAASIVEIGSTWLGFRYQPHPDTLRVKNYKTGQLVNNLDSRAVATFASYTGLLWKKGVDLTWADRLVEDNDQIILRYAEMLLTYAEAKIELGEIDAAALNALNQVRARAYSVNVNQTDKYPAVTTTDKNGLRTIIKRERRVEFAKEGLRYMDLIRWGIAEKALTKPVVGLPDPNKQDRTKWPFPGVPTIDEDGIPDYSALLSDVKVLAIRNFDKTKQYLWPIPATERRVNTNLTQNTGY